MRRVKETEPPPHHHKFTLYFIATYADTSKLDSQMYIKYTVSNILYPTYVKFQLGLCKTLAGVLFYI